MYDIIVIGAGPAGLTAALYARRAEKTVLVIEKESFGGQITHSPKVENYPGFVSISGSDLGDKMLEHATELGVEIELDTVTGISGERGDLTVTADGGEFHAKSVIIATGSKHRTLGLPDEELYTGEGVSYCAVCDGAFYKDKTVAIVGGGNSALQEAVLLSESCKWVYVIQNLPYLTGEASLAQILERRTNVSVICSHTVTELIGDGKTLSGIKIKNADTEAVSELKLDGVFVAIGQVPENGPFESAVTLNDYGYIEADEDCMPRSNLPGVFAAGDCRTKKIRQVATAVADGAVAALAAARFIDTL
ncbi:MAG: FAD-dependent oxidoreductase [Clostridia bacterium]|nr:FAD-dependent oxidoreductase [Clostridia bacterium]